MKIIAFTNETNCTNLVDCKIYTNMWSQKIVKLRRSISQGQTTCTAVLIYCIIICPKPHCRGKGKVADINNIKDMYSEMKG